MHIIYMQMKLFASGTKNLASDVPAWLYTHTHFKRTGTFSIKASCVSIRFVSDDFNPPRRLLVPLPESTLHLITNLTPLSYMGLHSIAVGLMTPSGLTSWNQCYRFSTLSVTGGTLKKIHFCTFMGIQQTIPEGRIVYPLRTKTVLGKC